MGKGLIIAMYQICNRSYFLIFTIADPRQIDAYMHCAIYSSFITIANKESRRHSDLKMHL